MKIKSMIAVALCVGSGCGMTPQESEGEAPGNSAPAAATAALTSFGTIKGPTVGLAFVVGTGTPASCTEAALDAALAHPGTVLFDCGGPRTIALTTSKTIASTVTIDGGSTITLSGDLKTRLFDVTNAGTLNLAHIVLENGSNFGDGGTISNHGYLNLNAVTIRNGNAGPAFRGGAIFTDGRNVRIDNSLFQGNLAGAAGGAIAMTAGGMQIFGSELAGNASKELVAGGKGGAIFVGVACLTVKDTAIRSNQAQFGGAIFAAPGAVVTVTGSPTPTPLSSLMIFDSNSALQHGGAILNHEATLSITNASLSHSKTSKAQGLGFGGAILNLGGHFDLTAAILVNNEGRFGGAIATQSNEVFFASTAIATTAIDRTIFRANSAEGGGGAMSILDPTSSVTVTRSSFEGNNTRDLGGGIDRIDGSLRVDDSSFTNNAAVRAGGALAITTPPGSAIPAVRLQSVTVSANTAPQGGAISNDRARLEMHSMTIAGNSSGVLTTRGGNSRFHDTVLQNPTNCAITDLIGSLTEVVDPGAFSDDGANFATDLTCKLSAQSQQGANLDARLGPLTKDPNGLTFFLKASGDSPLLDRGISCPALDQLGAPRNGPCDIGAVESGITRLGSFTFSGGTVLAP